MKYEKDTDKLLIIAIRNGDYVSYNKLFNKYYSRLCQYVYHIIPDTDDTEDIVQELFLQVWENRKKLDIQENVPAYLGRMAKNMTLNHIRKYTNYRMTLEQQEKILPYQVEDNELESNEFQEALYRCIDILPERSKEILLLHRVEGLKQKEIAEKLGITVKTVKNQIWISLQKLKDCLQGKGLFS